MFVSRLYIYTFSAVFIFLYCFSARHCLACPTDTIVMKDSLQIAAPQFEDTLSTSCIGIDLTKVDTLTVKDHTTEKKRKRLIRRFIDAFNAMDTTYIVPNYYNFAAMLQNTNFIQSYKIRAKDANGNSQSIRMRPQTAAKIGPYFGWRWIFLGCTFDVLHPKRVGEQTELSLSLYSQMLGLDAIYIKNKGNFKINSVNGFGESLDTEVRNVEFSGAETFTASVNAYYIFNHTRFSYPAGFAQSTVQRKSAGSWIVGLRFNHQRLNFDSSKLPERMQIGGVEGDVPICDNLKMTKFNYSNYSISGGYAYNWVFAPRFLLAVSMTPSIGLNHAKGEKINSGTLFYNVKKLNFDVITRLGVVYNTNRWFVGASAISHIFDYKKSQISMSNVVNYVNVYVGVNFHKRKQYR